MNFLHSVNAVVKKQKQKVHSLDVPGVLCSPFKMKNTEASLQVEWLSLPINTCFGNFLGQTWVHWCWLPNRRLGYKYYRTRPQLDSHSESGSITSMAQANSENSMWKWSRMAKEQRKNIEKLIRQNKKQWSWNLIRISPSFKGGHKMDQKQPFFSEEEM